MMKFLGLQLKLMSVPWLKAKRTQQLASISVLMETREFLER